MAYSQMPDARDAHRAPAFTQLPVVPLPPAPRFRIFAQVLAALIAFDLLKGVLWFVAALLHKSPAP